MSTLSDSRVNESRKDREIGKIISKEISCECCGKWLRVLAMPVAGAVRRQGPVRRVHAAARRLGAVPGGHRPPRPAQAGHQHLAARRVLQCLWRTVRDTI